MNVNEPMGPGQAPWQQPPKQDPGQKTPGQQPPGRPVPNPRQNPWAPVRVILDSPRVPFTQQWGSFLDVDVRPLSIPAGTLDMVSPSGAIFRHNWKQSVGALQARNALHDAILGSSFTQRSVPYTGQRPLPGRQQLTVQFANGAVRCFDLGSHMGDFGMPGVASALQGVFNTAFPNRYSVPRPGGRGAAAA